MSTVLFVDREEDMPEAISMINDYFYDKKRSGCMNRDEEMLGIVISAHGYRRAPLWKSFDMEKGTGVLSESWASDRDYQGNLKGNAVAIRSAFISGDAWAICTFDGPDLRSVAGREERREKVAAMLRDAYADAAWTFIPINYKEMKEDIPREKERVAPPSHRNRSKRLQGINERCSKQPSAIVMAAAGPAV